MSVFLCRTKAIRIRQNSYRRMRTQDTLLSSSIVAWAEKPPRDGDRFSLLRPILKTRRGAWGRHQPQIAVLEERAEAPRNVALRSDLDQRCHRGRTSPLRVSVAVATDRLERLNSRSWPFPVRLPGVKVHAGQSRDLDHDGLDRRGGPVVVVVRG